jgi:hypothetical protein
MSNRDDELEDELPESIESPDDVANFRRSNLDAFLQVQARTTGLLKQIHREGKDVWVAKSWINGRGK